jgi:hypothetical protein
MKRSPIALLQRPATLVLVAAGAALLAPPAQAFDSSFSGFGSLVVGRSFGACVDDATTATRYAEACTRYIADWAHGGVYTPSWSASQESRLGLQWTGNFNRDLSATVQVVGRLNEGQKVDLEWAYLTYKLTPSWSVQVGRKRLPLYYFSDFEDIGYSYPTLRPSPDVYGWDIVNYNGASLNNSTEFGDWSMRSSVFAGSETSKENQYSRIIYDGVKDISWNRIVGAWVEVTKDWFSARASYTQSGFKQVDHETGTVDLLPTGNETAKVQRFYGLALNADYEDWVVRSEWAASDRSEQGYKAKFYLLTVGYHLGNFTPAITSSSYKETSTFPDDYVPVRNATLSASLRYELNRSSALKLQVDRARDSGPVPFAGNATAVGVAYDFVF